MLKNLLATVGLVMIAKKGFELYQHYKEMERENEAWRKANADER